MRWIQDPNTLELVPADQYVRRPTESHYIIPDIEPYTSPITGEVISSRRQRRYDLEKHNCRPYEGKEQEWKEARRREAYRQERQDRVLTEAVQRSFAQLHPDQRRALGD